MRAAGMALQFEHPKLGVNVNVEGKDLGDLLERAIKRSGKVIEVEAIRAVEAKAKAIEVKPPVEPTVARSGPIPDRRFRRA
jgi:hypothetical protein